MRIQGQGTPVTHKTKGPVPRLSPLGRQRLGEVRAKGTGARALVPTPGGRSGAVLAGGGGHASVDTAAFGLVPTGAGRSLFAPSPSARRCLRQVDAGSENGCKPWAWPSVTCPRVRGRNKAPGGRAWPARLTDYVPFCRNEFVRGTGGRRDRADGLHGLLGRAGGRRSFWGCSWVSPSPHNLVMAAQKPHATHPVSLLPLCV